MTDGRELFYLAGNTIVAVEVNGAGRAAADHRHHQLDGDAQMN